MHELLLPFAEHTKTFQSDTTSMSLVVPALFDLLSHLTDFAESTRYRDLKATRPKQKSSTTSIRQQIIKYKEELSHPITGDTGTDFWLENSDSFYPSLKPFALDLLAMLASLSFTD